MTTEGNKTEGKKLKRPVEQIRAELLADADVKEQARLLKLPVEDYVEKILDYATHPEKPPEIYIVPDEVLKRQDPSIPTVAEIQTHLEKIVSGEIVISPAHLPDGFTNSKKPSNEQYKAALGNSNDPGTPIEPSPSAQNLDVKKGSTFKP